MAGGAAGGRGHRIDHRQHHETAVELLRNTDDGAAKVVDSHGDFVRDADGKLAVVAEIAVDISASAVDHMTALISHCYLQEAE